MGADNRTVFISSCTRRQMARRKPSRTPRRTQLLLVAIMLAVALGTFVAAGGGL